MLKLYILDDTMYKKELADGYVRDRVLEVLHPFVVGDGFGNSEVALGAALKQLRCDGGKALSIGPWVLPETDLLAIAKVEGNCRIE